MSAVRPLVPLPIANRMAIGGLVFLVLAMAGGVLLALDVVLPRAIAAPSTPVAA